jgi:hypothetical protein
MRANMEMEVIIGVWGVAEAWILWVVGGGGACGGDKDSQVLPLDL